ncbi:hypothetical protein SAMN05518672_108187 [Chitinophaga sp. CF118]|uniref:hypothetical protein n=1 Tax=Chitinophaga sp. CF118 TaxID=1884367 RepID=UPI0008EC1869|nr:hypothetical protein [Chitinophaga sp. CF118]SFE63542.1 hypothetical protein SAMN05518672_108187 [Chitinophaga sp. CF118]
MHTAFGNLFPEIADKETRVITIIDQEFTGLPLGTYALIDLYCTDLDCDCRNVYINVVNQAFDKPLATITYGWESLHFYKEWMGGDDEMLVELKGPALATFASQSQFAPKWLEILKDILNTDPAYAKRLQRHYELVKASIEEKQARK